MNNVLRSFVNKINFFGIFNFGKSKKDEKKENLSLILSPEKRFSIRVEKTSKKDVCIFHTSTPLYKNGAGAHLYIFPSLMTTQSESEDVKELVIALYETDICSEVTVRPFSVEFKKSATWDWSDATQLVTDAMFKYLTDKNLSRLEAPSYTSEDSRFRVHIKLFKSNEDRVVFNLSENLHDDDSCIYKVPPVGKCKKAPKEIQKLAERLITSCACANVAISKTAVYLTKPNNLGLDEFYPIVNDLLFAYLAERHPVNFK